MRLLAAALCLASLAVRAAAADDAPFSELSGVVATLGEGLPSAEDRAKMLQAAREYRVAALKSARLKLDTLAELVEKGEPASSYDADTVKFVASWLSVKPGDAGYFRTLKAASEAITKTLGHAVVHSVYPESRQTCAAEDSKAGIQGTYAWTHDDQTALCRPWLFSSAYCRRVVVIHEAFHSSGLVDIDTKLKFPKRTVEQALSDAAYMAGLVSQLHSKHEDGCP